MGVRLQAWAEGGLVVLALGLLASRLLWLDLAIFIADEAQLLLAAYLQNARGQWADASPLVGTQGISYGPSPVWFYALAQRVVGPLPSACIGFMCAAMTVMLATVAYALSRCQPRSRMRLALALVVMAASPYQFIWSRMAWDTLVDIGSGLMMAILLWSDTLSWTRRILLGIVIGIALSSHLMVIPLVVLVGLVLIIEHRREPAQLLRTLGPVVVIALLINLPYFGYIARTPIEGFLRGSVKLGEEADYGTRLLELARVSSLAGLSYFMDADWPHLAERLWPAPLSALQLFTLVAWSLLAVAGLVAAVLRARQLSPAQRRTVGLALGVVLVYPIFYLSREVQVAPHYQFPTWWVVPFAALLAVDLLPWRAARTGAAALLVVLGLTQNAVTWQWMAMIRDQGGGARAFHYRTSIGEQEQAFRTACAHGPPAFRLSTMVPLDPVAMAYQLKTTPACASKRVKICYGCDVTHGDPILLFRYPREGDFGLQVAHYPSGIAVR